MFENRVPKKTFKRKGDEVKGEWSRLHNEELYDLYSTGLIWLRTGARGRLSRKR